MLKRIAIVLALVVAAFVGIVIAQPSEYHVERSTLISAPADVVYAEVSDFRRWPGWSPWEKLDPGMKKTYTGQPGSIGSTYAWEGNDDVGSGKMTVIEAVPGQKMTQRLEFITPWEAVATTTHTLSPSAGGTRTVWSMDGVNTFSGKLAGLFMDMDAMIGADYDKGLAALKVVAEKKAAETQPSAKADDSANGAPAEAP